MQYNFLVWTLQSKVKKIYIYFFFGGGSMKTWKNNPQKKPTLAELLLFLQYWPNGPKTEILYHQKPLDAGLGI